MGYKQKSDCKHETFIIPGEFSREFLLDLLKGLRDDILQVECVDCRAIFNIDTKPEDSELQVELL